jgi:hypothetical protein
MSLTPTALNDDGRVAGAAAAEDEAAEVEAVEAETEEEEEAVGLPSSPKSHASRLTLPIERMPRLEERAERGERAAGTE